MWGLDFQFDQTADGRRACDQELEDDLRAKLQPDDAAELEPGYRKRYAPLTTPVSPSCCQFCLNNGS